MDLYGAFEVPPYVGSFQSPDFPASLPWAYSFQVSQPVCGWSGLLSPAPVAAASPLACASDRRHLGGCSSPVSVQLSDAKAGHSGHGEAAASRQWGWLCEPGAPTGLKHLQATGGGISSPHPQVQHKRENASAYRAL